MGERDNKLTNNMNAISNISSDNRKTNNFPTKVRYKVRSSRSKPLDLEEHILHLIQMNYLLL